MIFTTLICEFYLRQVRGNQQQSSKGMSPKTSIVALPVPSSQSQRSFRMVSWLDVWNTVILFYDTTYVRWCTAHSFWSFNLSCLQAVKWTPEVFGDIRHHRTERGDSSTSTTSTHTLYLQSISCQTFVNLYINQVIINSVLYSVEGTLEDVTLRSCYCCLVFE